MALFTINEAEDLLRFRVSGRIDPACGPAVKTLMETLERIPLAIIQAAAYLNRKKSQFVEVSGSAGKGTSNLFDHLSFELEDPRRAPGTRLSKLDPSNGADAEGLIS